MTKDELVDAFKAMVEESGGTAFTITVSGSGGVWQIVKG